MDRTFQAIRLQLLVAPAVLLAPLTVDVLLAVVVGSALVLAGWISWWHALVLAFAVLVGRTAIWFFRIARALEPDLLPPVVRCRTERLEIRRVQRSDSAAFEASLDRVMMDANGWPADWRRAAVLTVASACDLGREGRLIAVERSTGDPVAFASISSRNPPDVVSVGFHLTPEKRGKGLAVEAMAGVFEVMHDAGIDVVHIGTNEDNLGMQAVIDRAGGVFEDTREHQLPNGSTVQSHWYSHRAIELAQ